MPNLTFCGKHEHKTTTLFFFPWTSIQSFKIQLQKNCQHLTKWTRWDKRDQVWSSATSIFEWRFRSRSRRRRCCLSFLLWQILSTYFTWKCMENLYVDIGSRELALVSYYCHIPPESSQSLQDHQFLVQQEGSILNPCLRHSLHRCNITIHSQGG